MHVHSRYTGSEIVIYGIHYSEGAMLYALGNATNNMLNAFLNHSADVIIGHAS